MRILFVIFALTLLLYAPAYSDNIAPPEGDATTQQTPIQVLPFKASYTLKKGGLSIGHVDRELKQDSNGDYIFESLSKPIGIATVFVKDEIKETSHWRLIENNFRPESYSYQRTGGKKDRHVKLVFDWETKKVTNIINDDAWKMDIPENVQDKLLYQLTIMYDLAEAGSELSYEVADGGRLKDYSFRVLSHETISTDIGELKTIKIRRNHKQKTITIWCAVDRNYLPVRIEQSDDEGGELELHIDKVAGL